MAVKNTGVATQAKGEMIKAPEHTLAIPVEMDVSELEAITDLVEATNDVRADDRSIPMLCQVQSLSRIKEVTDLAKEGMLYNNMTFELYDIRTEPINVIPVDFRIKYVEWTPSNKFVGRYPRGCVKGDLCENNGGSVQLDNGNKVNKTAYWTVLFNGNVFVFAMAVTKLKASKAWNALIDQQKYIKDGAEKVFPRFFFSYNIKGFLEKGERGNYWNYKIELGEQVKNVNLIRKAVAVLKEIDDLAWKEEESETKVVDESVM